METKVCTRCGKELPLDAFNKSKKSKDGLQPWCRECQHDANANAPRRKRNPLAKYSLDELKQEIKSRVSNLVINPTPREMMETLAKMGYRGKLEYTQVHVIDITNF